MSQYLVLSHIKIQNANSIAGFTWGFPAITGFLGFTHALSRKISNQFEGQYDTTLNGCAVVSHKYQNKVYQPKNNADFEFIQSRNPPVLEDHKNGKKVPVIEEGKINLTVSLVIELGKNLNLTEELLQKFEEHVLSICSELRLAGGTILGIKQAKLLSANTQDQQRVMLKKIKRLTLPGFVLLDRSQYLQEHYKNILINSEQDDEFKPSLLDAWLDFCALKLKATPKLKKDQKVPNENTDADWKYVPKPQKGFLVPLMTGYKAISEIFKPGEVSNVRDMSSPSCFVEAVHSIGEWKGIHSLDSIDSVLWRYNYDDGWYICEQDRHFNGSGDLESDTTTSEQELLQNLNFNDALNNW